MALKPDRISVNGNTDVSFFMNETAERGLMTIHSNIVAERGVGAAMDDPNAIVVVATGGTGDLPAGLLLNDMVNLDLTRQHINWHKDEVQLGGKVTLMRQGQVTTDQIEAAKTPKPGDPLHFTTAGQFTTDVGDSTQVGRWLSSKDADGFAKLEINIT